MVISYFIMFALCQTAKINGPESSVSIFKARQLTTRAGLICYQELLNFYHGNVANKSRETDELKKAVAWQ